MKDTKFEKAQIIFDKIQYLERYLKLISNIHPIVCTTKKMDAFIINSDLKTIFNDVKPVLIEMVKAKITYYETLLKTL